MARPDYADRSPDGLARAFAHWGEVEAPQLAAPLYRELALSVARDPELLAIAAHAPPSQPAPNLLFAAVHFLLLRGAEHPLRRRYASLGGGATRQTELRDAAGELRDFCLARRAEVEALVASRLTQTNVIQRCSALLPAFACVWREGGERPLAQIEIGCSAGLNLQWSRFRYVYRGPEGVHEQCWGDPDSPVEVPCELRSTRLPALPSELPVAFRLGIDLRPVALDDADAIDWLRALVWPEHSGRHERLAAAIELARRDPPHVRAADAAQALPEALSAAPADATLCVYGTHTLYQFSPDALRAVFRDLREASASRPVFFVGCEGTGDRFSELRLAAYRGGERQLTNLARCNPHGRWLEWLA